MGGMTYTHTNNYHMSPGFCQQRHDQSHCQSTQSQNLRWIHHVLSHTPPPDPCTMDQEEEYEAIQAIEEFLHYGLYVDLAVPLT